MKIDPRIQSAANELADRIGSTLTSGTRVPGAAKGSGVSPSHGEDTVILSVAHSEIHKLAAFSASLPEVRAARVSVLQQQVALGKYQPDSQEVADAVFNELSGNSFKD